MNRLCSVAAMLLISAAAIAQGASQNHVKPPSPPSVIVADVNGLKCQTTAGTDSFDVMSWSWGVENSSTIGSATGGAGAGKATFGELNVHKKFDQCSPALFGAVSTGKHFSSLTLTQEDSNGNVLLTLTLDEVLVTNWQVSGSVHDEFPGESVNFAFAKICVKETAGGTKFCWDVVQNKSF